MKRWIAVAGFVVAGILCIRAIAADTPEAPPYDKSISAAEALNIAEATFRYQFEHNASAVQQKAQAYFISVFKQDPSPEFLKRFAGHEPPVRKGSEFKDGTGLAFRVEEIQRVNATKVEVSGGYYEGYLSSSGNTYVVEKKDGKWIVTGSKMHWIS